MASLSTLILIVLLNILFNPTSEQTLDTLDYDAYGERLSLNEYFGVLAANDQQQFLIFHGPYSSTTCINFVAYTFPSQYVYSVAVGSKQNAGQSYFAFIAEYLNSVTTPSIIQVFFGLLTFTNCSTLSGSLQAVYLGQQYEKCSVLGIDPYGSVVFVVSPISIAYVDIHTFIAVQWSIPISYPWQFSPRSMVVDQNQIGHVAGYSCISDIFCYSMLVKTWKDPLSGFSQTYTQSVGNGERLTGSLFSSSARTADMSLSINIDSRLLLLGVPHQNQVLIYQYSSNTANVSYYTLSILISKQLGTGFGKSVAWLDNNTIAVLAYSLSTLPWSTSQVQVYHLDDLLQMNGTASQPYSSYPNNQQILIETNGNPLPKVLLMIVSWSSNSLAILSDAGDILLLPQSSPGFSSSKLTAMIDPGKFYIYLEESCIPGTMKDNSYFSPCFVCLPSRKNNGNSGIQCEICSNDSFCSLASTNDIIDDSTISYDQADPYPQSAELTNFEDILLNRVFTFGSTSHCRLISPLFWVLIVLGIVILLILIMGILQFCPKGNKHRQILKEIFSRVDLIGEGELWIGGLLSLVLAVMLSFAYAFSSHFINFYPTEKLTDQGSLLSCDSSMINAQFSTNVQLLSLKKLEEEKDIFDMLDSQSLTLIIELVNTGFTCQNLSIQQNTGPNSPSILWRSFSCSLKGNNSTLRLSTILPNHQMIMQFTLIGPYFIGGLRICFAGDSLINDNYLLQQLDICQFFSTANQTLSNSPYVNVQITKILNRTVALSPNDPDQYSGRWLPSLTISPLSDALLYIQNGDYFRYLTYQTVLIIDIQENQFYVKNTEQPIIKQAEIVFQSILFTTRTCSVQKKRHEMQFSNQFPKESSSFLIVVLCIELFGLFFLIMKLTIVPLIRLIQHRLSKMNNQVRINEGNGEENEHKMKMETIELSTISTNNPPLNKVINDSFYNPRLRSFW